MPKVFIKLLLLLIVYFFLRDIDISLAKRRAIFISEIIESYRENNNEVLYRLSDMNEVFDISNNNTESYCDFWDRSIDGIGYCFYTYNSSDQYYILISSLFNSLIYSSEDKNFIMGDGLN